MKKTLIFAGLMLPALSFAQLTDSTKRLVHLKGALNFRDIGGYQTKDGKSVKWNKVFRSASINKLTDGDMDTLRAKQIYTVVDLRGTKEAADAPDRLLEGTDYTLSPAGSDALPNNQQMMALLKNGNFLEDFYGKSGIKYFGERYKPVFQKLLALDDKKAMLYHCTGGRDRTGMATALFLYILGVPEKKIEQDFTASNVYLEPMMGKNYGPMAQATGMTAEEIKAKMDLRPELLHIFFDTIKAQYGSVESFMEKEMGIGSKEIKILKSKYTI
ncbi:tyrosine-protein phosphatase [Pedobacter sp. GR22-6]|uniref:tyrosine-protein phosphatase n=1 Tax=Pedobacter sp. GR22-6 TaxID=3127957 RepID=UPI00307E3015